MSLNIEKLSKKYGTNIVLNNINLKLNPGEIISIIGSSGCGKTTLLKCISGLCDINHGTIKINSKPIHNLSPNKRNIGYVFQESPLLPHLNIIDNIVFNMKYYNEDKLNYLLEKIQIKHLKKRYPYEISGGENQRIAVVRSLIRNPDLFLLDEPFNNLDKLTKEHTKELIFNIIKETNTTTMIVNHDIHDSLELSDRVLVLDKTKINMLDTPLKVYSEPKDLNTAKLFGELNTLKIKEKNIYFRPQDVDLVEESDIQAQVIQSKFVGIFYKTIAKVGEENVIIYHKKKLKINTEIYLDIKPKKQLNFH